MSDSFSLTIKTVDNAKKASVTLPATVTVEQLLSRTQQQWQLPSDENYAVRLERTGQQLEPSTTLKVAGVQSNDILEILPLLIPGVNYEC